MINDLIRSINSSSLNEAEYFVEELAKSRADVQFSLLNINDDQEQQTTKSKSNGDITEFPKSVLQLVRNKTFLFISFEYVD
jgi:hypothetical protein